jgi:LPS-assembly lipoprotein
MTMIVALAGCGFEPMYGKHSAFAARTPLAGNLVIDPMSGREGQILKAALEDRLNPEGTVSANPEYRLHITMTKNLIPAVIRSDGTIQRYDVQFITSFRLIGLAQGRDLLSGDLRRTGSYNTAINANFATYEAGQDAIERTLRELAEDYVLRLTGYFAGKK